MLVENAVLAGSFAEQPDLFGGQHPLDQEVTVLGITRAIRLRHWIFPHLAGPPEFCPPGRPECVPCSLTLLTRKCVVKIVLPAPDPSPPLAGREGGRIRTILHTRAHVLCSGPRPNRLEECFRLVRPTAREARCERDTHAWPSIFSRVPSPATWRSIAQARCR